MDRTDCNRNCWISAAIAGVLVVLFTSGIGDLGIPAGLFLGLVTFVLFGALMVWLVCEGRPEGLAGIAGHEGPAPGVGMTGSDWARQSVERQAGAMLSSPLGPEAPQSVAQIPIVAGALPADAGGQDAPAPASGRAPGDAR